MKKRKSKKVFKPPTSLLSVAEQKAMGSIPTSKRTSRRNVSQSKKGKGKSVNPVFTRPLVPDEGRPQGIKIPKRVQRAIEKASQVKRHLPGVKKTEIEKMREEFEALKKRVEQLERFRVAVQEYLWPGSQ